MKMVSWCEPFFLFFCFLNPTPQLNPKPEIRNPKLNRTPKTRDYLAVRQLLKKKRKNKTKQDFIAVRLLLKKKREDLDAYLEMLDTQVPLFGFFLKKKFSKVCSLVALDSQYTRALA
jgi:hypothetical protein